MVEEIDYTKLTVYPINKLELWNLYKKQLSSFWTVEEVDLSSDLKDWNKLTKNEVHFIKNILAFFATSDGIVNLNLLENFSTEVPYKEANIAYGFQATMENIHGEMYSLLLNTYITDDNEKEKLFNGITTIPCIKKKAEWALKWIKKDDENIFMKRLIAFAVVEGIFFSGSFCAIFWLKQRNLLHGLTLSNEFIARDEGMHTQFACVLYETLSNDIKQPLYNKVNQKTVHNIVEEAVKIEQEFINESIPCKLIGMNKELMSQYIEYVADILLQQLKYEKVYNVKNPFSFMDAISMEGKSNFFETRVSQYQKADTQKEFEITDEF